MSPPDSDYLEAQLAWMGTLARRIAQMRVVIDAARDVLGDFDPCGDALPALRDALRDYDAGLPPRGMTAQTLSAEQTRRLCHLGDPDTLPVRWMSLDEARRLYEPQQEAPPKGRS